MTIWKDLVLSRGIAAAFAVVGIYWGAFAALVPAIKRQTGLSDADFGLALLAATSGMLVAMWLAPWLQERLRHAALPGLAAALALAFLVPGTAGGWWLFALGMLLASVTSGTLDILMNADLSALEARSGRSLMNLNHGIFSVAYALSAFVAGLLREAGLAPLPVLTLCGLGTAAMLAVMLRARLPAPHVDNPVAEAGRTDLSLALLVPAGVVILIGFLAEQATEGWSALHLEREHDAGAALAALGPTILGLTMAVGRLSAQVVASRYSQTVVTRAGAILSAAGALIAAWAPALWLAYLGFAILGLGVSVVAPMMFAWVGAHVPDRQRARAIARISVIGYAGFFIGPPLMGFLAEGFGLSVSFSAVALLLLAIPVLFLPMLARRG